MVDDTELADALNRVFAGMKGVIVRLDEYCQECVDCWQSIQAIRRRAAKRRARQITWMKGNKHIWAPKPTKAQGGMHASNRHELRQG